MSTCAPGDEVTAQQMTSQFAEVKRPNADAITRALMDRRGAGSGSLQQVPAAVNLGRPFKVVTPRRSSGSRSAAALVIQTSSPSAASIAC